MTAIDRLRWQCVVAQTHGRTGAALAVASGLAYMANNEGVCWPSILTLANATGLTRSGAKAGIRFLRQSGLLAVELAAVGKRADRRVSRYTLLLTTVTVMTAVEGYDGHGDDLTTVTVMTPEHIKRTVKHPSSSTRAKSAPKQQAPNGWKVWLDVHAESGFAKPLATGPDTAASKTLAKLVPDTHELQEIMRAYRADSDPFLSKQGWPLRLLPCRVNAYLTQVADRIPQLTAEQIADIESLEAEIERGAS